MGNTCGVPPETFTPVNYEDPSKILGKDIKIVKRKGSRFGEIQKLRTKKDSIYRLIMPANDKNNTTVNVQIRIMSSVADFQLYDGTKFQLKDLMLCPILDVFDNDQKQVYHHIITNKSHSLTMKVYSFTSYNDSTLKNGLYQISLYNQLSQSPLVDYFIMSRGKINALVMMFKYYENTLFQILQYRKLAHFYRWNNCEVALLWKMLIKGYRQLEEQDICHRDIRLNKIFYTPSNKNIPYQFINLESARKFGKNKNNQKDDDLISVRGVNLFACEPLIQAISSKTELKSYDPHKYDFACLKRVLLSIYNLATTETNLICVDPEFNSILDKLGQENVNLYNLEEKLDTIIGRFKTEQKQNAFADDRKISEDLMKIYMKKQYQAWIEEGHINTLVLLHKKEEFNKILISKMQNQFGDYDKQKNVALLHKIGDYYQKIGIANNDYYKQQISLRLELIEQYRITYFYTTHKNVLIETKDLYKSYKGNNQEFSIKLQIETVYLYHHQIIMDPDNAQNINLKNQRNKTLSELLFIVSRSNNLSLQIQTESLLTKTLVYIEQLKFEQTQNTLDIISKMVEDVNMYETLYSGKRYQAKFYYLKALFYQTKFRISLKDNKLISFSKEALKYSLAILSNLPQSHQTTIQIVNAYFLQAQLQFAIQQLIESVKSIEKADLLLRSQLQMSHKDNTRKKVSTIIIKKVLYQMKKITDRIQGYDQEKKRRLTKRIEDVNHKKTLSNAEMHERRRMKQQRLQRKLKNQRQLNDNQAIKEENSDDEYEQH